MHPEYNKEWQLFYSKRCTELQQQNVSIAGYDFKPEWSVVWKDVIENTMATRLERERQKLLEEKHKKEYGVETIDLTAAQMAPKAATTSGGHTKQIMAFIMGAAAKNSNDTSSSVVESNGKMPSTSATDSKNDNNSPASSYSVISTLKYLSELEGGQFDDSTSSALSRLLLQAVNCNFTKKNPLHLFADMNNLHILQVAKQAFRVTLMNNANSDSLLESSGGHWLKAIDWIQSSVWRNYFAGIDVSVVARKTVGLSMSEVAQAIARDYRHMFTGTVDDSVLLSVITGVSKLHEISLRKCNQ